MSLLVRFCLRNLKPQNSTILLVSSRLRWLPSSRLVLRVFILFAQRSRVFFEASPEGGWEGLRRVPHLRDRGSVGGRQGVGRGSVGGQ
eukprot:7961349-Pyramimonas_sp.AAC.1